MTEKAAGPADCQAPWPEPCPDPAPADHRKGPRRRGEELNRAIYDATMAELAEVGYANLTMDRVAGRARTGKASLYRRWLSRAELVADAVRHDPEAEDVPEAGSLRADLLSLLRHAADQLDGPRGEAARGLIAEALGDPERTALARMRMTDRRRRLMADVLDRAAARGEIPARPLPPRVVGLPMALLAHHFLTQGAPIADEVIAEIVDEVVLPLLQGRPAPAAAPAEPGPEL